MLTNVTVQSDPATGSSLVRPAILAVVGSVIANLILWFILEAALEIPPEFPPFNAAPIAFFTLMGALGAVIVYALVRRVTARPKRTFQLIAFVVLLLSIIPNILIAMDPANPPFPMPGVSTVGMVALILFHVVAWAVIVRALTSSERE